jgi:hypothetical protein
MEQEYPAHVTPGGPMPQQAKAGDNLHRHESSNEPKLLGRKCFARKVTNEQKKAH